MIFIGYHPTRAYKLFDPIKEKVVLSRDVVILEHESWNWKLRQTSLVKMIIDGEADNPISAKPKTTSRSSDGLQNSWSHSESDKSRRQCVLPQRFTEYEVYSDAQIGDGGDLVHMEHLQEQNQ